MQSLHFQLVFSAARKAGLCPETTRLDHVGFGVVLGEDKYVTKIVTQWTKLEYHLVSNRKRLKTRSGKTILLAELLDEGMERALDTLKKRKRDMVEA